MADLEVYIICSTQNPKTVDGRLTYTPLTKWAITKPVAAAANNAKITKPVNLHNFHASRATYLDALPEWTEQRLKKFQGWTKDSRILERYVRDIGTEEAVQKTY